jgi:uncharacterized protein
MLMPDVSILVYAHREDERTHAAYRRWVEAMVDGIQPFALSVLVAVGFVRVVTNSRIYPTPTPLPLALATVESLASHPRCRVVAPGPAHLTDVAALCRSTGATGKLVADAQHAVVATAAGCTWVTRDRDFSRFEPHGLRWEHLVLG